MSLNIPRLIDKLYPRNNAGYRVTVIGSGLAGKTTLLYLLKLGEVIHTVSLPGFNIETVDPPTTSGKPFKLECCKMGAGRADFRQISCLYITYTASSEAIIWVVDASDHSGLQNSSENLQYVLNNINVHRKIIGLLRDCPILILANKQDLPNVIPIDDIRKAFANTLSCRVSCVFKTSLMQDKDKTGLPAAFNWLRGALERVSTDHSTRPTLPTIPVSLNSTLESWLRRAETDKQPSQFMSEFHSKSLSIWDHYTRIRVTFLLLTTYGRREGQDRIFKGIEKYANSPEARGHMAHVTMAYFWIQMVHLGIRRISPSMDLKRPQLALTPALTNDEVASPDQFPLFLMLDPRLMDEDFWEDYYSRDVMMGIVAKGAMALPDKKPLPNLIMRDLI